ncbi:MAG: alpha/beta fold hydrolase [Gammaproteobacteria bacterium]|nr:MAG: alpha/beta fold hydrolase [Gammaproteobacteria bacterium]
MTQKAIRDLALIHGWGFDHRIWRNLIPHLEDQWRVTCIDLPGYGASKNKVESHLDQGNIDQIVNYINSDIPENATILAWSLGGTVAMKLAQRRSDIKALVLLASSPCFLKKQDWQHGVEPAEFNQLLSQLSKDKIKTLQTFAGLVAMGEAHPRQTINELNEYLLSNVPEQETLMSGLGILRDEDLRQALVKQHCPVGIIFGENDILVKRSIGSAIQELRPDTLTIEIPETGHAPFLSRPQETADALMKLTARVF